MRMPRGRCDIQAKDQIAETPEPRAPVGASFQSAAHYNRLELAPINRVSRAAMPPAPQHAWVEIRTSGGHDRQVIYASTKPWVNSFLVHEGESCNKQVSGVARLRRGIAQ